MTEIEPVSVGREPIWTGPLEGPPIMAEIIDKAKGLLSTLSQPAYAAMLDVSADGSECIATLNLIIDQATSDHEAWVTAHAAVTNASNQWGTLAGQLSQALADCQWQVLNVQNYWSGTAATNFNLYMTQILFPLWQDAANDFQAVGDDLGTIASQIGDINITATNDGAQTVVDLLNAVIQSTNTELQQVPTILAGPIGIALGIGNIVASWFNNLNQAYSELNTCATQVGIYLNGLQTTSSKLQDDVNLHFAQEPTDLSDSGLWNPK
jgi:hypothetical protein